MSIELTARFYCDRCNATMFEMFDVADENEAYKRIADAEDNSWGAEDEYGNDVCAACWRKWNAKHSPVGVPAQEAGS